MSLFGIGMGSSAPGGAHFIGLGLVQLKQQPFVEVLSVGDLIEGPGVGTDAGAWYRNTAALIRSPLFPDDLMRSLLAIEQCFGRVRTTQNAARTLDLDLLLSSLGRYQSPRVTLPHPRFHLRDFAKIPLRQAIQRAELSPRERSDMLTRCAYSSKENFCMR